MVSLSEAQTKLEAGNWLVVAGYFDPVTASAVQRLDKLVSVTSNERVLIAVLEDAGSLLNSSERCALIAALRMVDNVVVISEDQLDTLFGRSERLRCVADLEADRRDSNEFAQLVLNKEQLAVRLDGAAS